MDAPVVLWSFRLVWLVLPFTLAEHLDDVVADAPGALRWATAALFWAVWAATLLASLVPLPSTLTLLRVLAPTAPSAAALAVLIEAPGAAGWVGFAAALAGAALAASAVVGDWFVDGPSYGDERRFALRPPAALLLGPLELAWLLTVVPLPVGVLLLADRRWVAGTVLCALGVPSAWWGYLASWQLARRWAVFVPAGVTLVDDMALAQPVLFPAPAIGVLGPAEQGTDALDLTVGAPGLVVQLTLREPVELVTAATRARPAEATAAVAVLVVPSRPGALLAEAERRGLPVGAADAPPA